MQRTFVTVIGATLMSAAFLSAQNKSTAPASSGPAAPPAGKAVTYIGCLGPGSDADSYTLSNGEEKGNKDKAAAHVTFKVVGSSDKVKLEDHVTQAVEITGTFSDSTPPAGESESAKSLPTFKATSVKWQADYCGLPF
jgi:hypothetical protein